MTDKNNRARDRSSTVKNANGLTGDFLDAFVTASHSLDNPSLMTYSETDPTSLKFVGKLDRSRDTFRLVRAKLDLPQTRIDFFAFDLAGQDQAAATKFGMSQPEWKRAAAPR